MSILFFKSIDTTCFNDQQYLLQTLQIKQMLYYQCCMSYYIFRIVLVQNPRIAVSNVLVTSPTHMMSYGNTPSAFRGQIFYCSLSEISIYCVTVQPNGYDICFCLLSLSLRNEYRLSWLRVRVNPNQKLII